MAMMKEEIIEWLAAVKDGSYIGIDDGGLAMTVVGKEGEWLEIGGCPEFCCYDCGAKPEKDELDVDGCFRCDGCREKNREAGAGDDAYHSAVEA